MVAYLQSNHLTIAALLQRSAMCPWYPQIWSLWFVAEYLNSPQTAIRSALFRLTQGLSILFFFGEVHTPPFFRWWKTAKHQPPRILRQKRLQRMTFNFRCFKHFISPIPIIVSYDRHHRHSLLRCHLPRLLCGTE